MRERYIEVQGLRTCYYDVGQGPTIVLLHGAALGDDAYITWYRNIEPLAKFFRVIAFDQVCFGRTDLPFDGKFKGRHERIDHAVAFLRALGIENATLVGHSEGGFIATRIAIIEPSLVGRLVVVASSATAPYLGGDADASWIKDAEAAYTDFSAYQHENTFVEKSFLLNYLRDPLFEQLLRENYRRARTLGHYDLLMNQATTNIDYSERERITREYIHNHLNDLKIPTLLIWALNDQTAIVERGIKLLQMIPSAELHIFASAKHFVMSDRANDFNRLIIGWCAHANLECRRFRELP